MEVSSVLLCSGCSPWQGFLLTASLLTSWLLPTTAQVTLESSPPQVVEGENVLLSVDNMPENIIGFGWFKGETDMNRGIALYSLRYTISLMGPVHSGRETLYGNGSLWIKNVTQEDTGFYTFRIINKHGKIQSNTTLFLHVKSSLFVCGHPFNPEQPTIESVPVSVSEWGSVLLRVHHLPNYLRTLFWYRGALVLNKLEIVRYRTFKDSYELGPAHSGRETMFNTGSLLLQNVTWKDTGFYTLRTLSTEFNVELIHIYLQVNKPVTQPILRVTESIVTVQSSVVFTCLSDNTGVSIRWLFKNQNLQVTERMTLSPSNCQLRIHAVRKKDAGQYRCEVFNPISSKTSLPVSLAVMNE
uniref:Carcinoembryonic antigen-related cell adhesion molecule 3-like n=1 Tax=Rattus norvegicus TaxID=10116 RepID=A0A0G2K838_RAT